MRLEPGDNVKDVVSDEGVTSEPFRSFVDSKEAVEEEKNSQFDTQGGGKIHKLVDE